ncbi:MAG: GNAT family N-acetyltransferase [Betaproteobacteria bacterium]
MPSPAFSVVQSLSGIAPIEWDTLVGDRPLLAHAFLHALHETGCASAKTGWTPQYIVGRQDGRLVAAMPLYLKTHSYGEYVFDWAWADAYHRHRRRYYPKLLCAVPFTPATGPRLIAGDPALRAALWREACALAVRLRTSSLHVLFPEPGEAAALTAPDILQRHGIQFRWENQGYADFAAFLAAFSHDKRKKIRQDRARVEAAGVTFRWLDGRTATATDWKFFYACYANTYREHHSTPYLTHEFFLRIAQTMPANVLLVIGERDGRRVCAAFNIHDANTLWGRYWGTTEFVSGLHFETCYYQAIAFCIERRIGCFEGGAQGGHKLARGFLPTRTNSLHWIADPDFSAAIADFLARESSDIGQVLDELMDSSPYRADFFVDN